MPVRSRLAVAIGLLVFTFAALGPMARPTLAYTWVWPTTGRITQGYGCTGFSWEPPYGSCRHFHKGIDIASDAWTKIRSASSGVVKYVGWNPYDPVGDQAWIVRIKHDNGLLGLYGHMKAVRVDGARAGDRVKAGQLIGYMGSTGMSTGVHLHFGFFRDGVPKNPRLWITTSFSSSSTAQAALYGTSLDGVETTDTIASDRPMRQPAIKRYPLRA